MHVEGDGDRLTANGLDKSVDIALNLNTSLDAELSLAGNIGVTLLILSNIGIIFLRVDVVIKDIIISEAHKSAIATHVSVFSRAVDEFLLRNAGNLNLLVNGISRLKGTGGGKSPARTALSLILNSLNLFGLDPVDLLRVRIDRVNVRGRILTLGSFTDFWEVHEILGLTLSEGQVTELVNAESVSLSRVSVVGLDFLESFSENLLSVGLFSSTGVDLALLGLEYKELRGDIKGGTG